MQDQPGNLLSAAVYPYAILAAKAAVYLAGAAFLTFATRALFRNLQRFSDRMVEERGGSTRRELGKQTVTITNITQRSIVFAIWALTAILVLELFGLEVRPLLAGAGAAGLVVGFAAQSLLKDLISGAMLLAEGRIRINDVVKIDNVSGVVEELSLRVTVLRSVDGAVHVIPNGNITNFANLTQSFSYYVFDINADYGHDTDRTVELLRDAAEEVRADPEYAPWILAPLDVLGVDSFAEAGVVVKARIKTIPNEQWKVGREINRRLKRLADERGVPIATAQRSIQLHDIDPEFQNRVRGMVREALDEERKG